MTFPIRFTDPRTAERLDPAAPLRAFVAEHRDALRGAARLLGGYAAAGRVEALAEALSHEVTLSRSTRRRLDDLRDLLRLEHVGDPDRVEMGFFACIDPADPAVEEICLLTDGLADAIAAWQDAEAISAGRRRRPAA